MKKYVLYRAPGKVDRDLGKHELVGVEYGEDIFAATDALIRAVCDDLSENQEYKTCRVWAYAPEETPLHFRTKRYQYFMDGIVSPPGAEKNIIISYGIIETENSP